ncbi:MAG: hypothetical protein AAF318_03230 [Pseudomonadota bacterium]
MTLLKTILKGGVAALAVLSLPLTAQAADVDVDEPVDSDVRVRIETALRLFDMEAPAPAGSLSTPNGVIPLDLDLNPVGVGLGLSVLGEAELGGVPVSLEGYASLSFATDEASATRALGNNSALAIEGLTTGNGAQANVATLLTAPNTADAALFLTGVDGAGFTATINQAAQTIGPGPGGNLAVSESAFSVGRGAIVAGIFTDGTPNATAFGIVASDRGIAITAAGDLSGFTLANTYNSDLIFAGADARIGPAEFTSGSIGFRPFVGPSLKTYQNDLESVTFFDSGARFAAAPGVARAPSATVTLDEDIDGNYFGGVAGFEVNINATERLSFGLRGVGGLYYLDANYTGEQRATVDSGNNIFNVTAQQVGDTEGRLAATARLDGTVAYEIANGVSLGLTGTGEYLSAAPTVRRFNNSTTVSGGNQNSAVAGDPLAPGSNTSLDFFDTFSAGVGLDLTFRF